MFGRLGNELKKLLTTADRRVAFQLGQNRSDTDETPQRQAPLSRKTS
jgi:hypothetical protein